jgi:hypothetical protein
MPCRWDGSDGFSAEGAAGGGVPPCGSASAVVPDAALLLEGSWPADAPCHVCRSLDELIDGRFDWIDQQAADLAELLGGPEVMLHGLGRSADCISPAYLNVLALRYYLVKLIRPLAYLTEVQPLRPGDCLELVAAAKRDEGYADVLFQYCQAAGVHYRVRWVQGGTTGRAGGFPANRLWRRCMARLSGYLQPPLRPRSSGRRVVLCGNPRLLDLVCRELVIRGCRLWWLHDRFAFRSWLRWQAAGVGQLACNSSLGGQNRLLVRVPERLECRGVNLARPVRQWLAEQVAAYGPRQTRLIEQIDVHFRRLHPHAVVLDEDATPLARAAVAVGRRYGAASMVVQHGAPYCRFGFTPPAADRILVWGRSSRQRLIDWGTPAERIRITGSPQHDRLRRQLRRRCHRSSGRFPAEGSNGKSDRGDTSAEPTGAAAGWQRHAGCPRHRILLLTTVPPRDDRPDAIALHLTGRTYAQMLRTAFAAVAGIGGAELIVKLHPRSGDDPVVRAVRTEFPSVGGRLVRPGSLEDWLGGVSCVLSCGSSAGVEATLAGVPVIQLAPPGATGFLPHERWGLAGTARSETELRRLLAQVAAGGWWAGRGLDTDVFAEFGRAAATRIADEVLAPLDPLQRHRWPEPTPAAAHAVQV